LHNKESVILTTTIFMSKPFYFKQFKVNQSQSAMKVGTDGVLLGAWVNAIQPHNILDIGTGTGLIALMMAQKFPAAQITAIEPEMSAFQEAVNNFNESQWSDRIVAKNTTLQHFKTDEKFDLIVSNPPFYNSTFKELEEKRAKARHSASLSYSDLLISCSKLLNNNGLCFFILPFSEEGFFLEMARKCRLFPVEICRVRGHQDAPLKRILIALAFHESELKETELTIEISRGTYTEAYINLVKDFYLKM
jgi:tRNA1Val (adenine37-N6)-methyltransferase